ncbi:arrestin [Cordyceps fumosorosea ARSEF 2679]|uniref:Arrestin n=1 Tax=Cordyceps fumosorosea (strain ARSEF 2679) TaxID=1081104 RepID=A0A168D2Y6_CORFA|nr:arrestin [Cordyceps fumosorosea ARSEF 2679]OAA72106.1 arrestin [Cordyceps fumosorosea ARSEF 2679]
MAGNPSTRRLREPRQALQVTISIDDSSRNEPQVYTTGSLISGRAIIRSDIDAYCEDAEILLLGLAGTRLELTRHKPTRALSPFLKMYMMTEAGDGGILELESPFPGPIAAGETISIPFRFVVPQYLLEGSCRHPCASHAVWERHSHLPPTLDGASDIEEHEFLARGRIQYYVEMRLRCYDDDVGSGAGCGMSKVVAGRQVVTILPALPELPPLPLDSVAPGSFLPSKSVVVRRNLVQRAGRLAVSSAQPPAMMLDPSGRSSPCSVVRMDLDFRPGDCSARPPPSRLVVSGTALGTTHLCAEPSELLPELSGEFGGGGGGKSPTTVQYSSTCELFPRTPLKPAWRWSQDPTDGGGGGGGGCYRAQLEMPLLLPACQRKPILPTFYSCLISQTYILEVKISLGCATSDLSLTLPLQIGVCSTDFSPSLTPATLDSRY